MASHSDRQPVEVRFTLPRYGTAIEPEGFSTEEAIERHVCRPPEKSHPRHCAHCYYPWPCPTVVLYRRVIGDV